VPWRVEIIKKMQDRTGIGNKKAKKTNIEVMYEHGSETNRERQTILKKKI